MQDGEHPRLYVRWVDQALDMLSALYLRNFAAEVNRHGIGQLLLQHEARKDTIGHTSFRRRLTLLRSLNVLLPTFAFNACARGGVWQTTGVSLFTGQRATSTACAQNPQQQIRRRLTALRSGVWAWFK